MIIAWGLAIGGWFIFLAMYAGAAGAVGPVPDRWPAEASIPAPTRRPTLLMFVHPHCPCTRASLEELARLVTHTQGLADLRVLFILPDGFADKWERTDLWEAAEAIPGVRVTTDRGGVEAQRFGATISGQVFLYAPGGTLLFCGGITAARGHAGDNVGLDSVRQWLRGNAADGSRSPVYGCPLLDEPCSRDESRCCGDG